MKLKSNSQPHYHILGSCGVLMAGLCQLALDAGLNISGSDMQPSPPMSDLLPQKCLYLLEQKKYLEADYVVVGNIFRFDSPEIIEIRNKGIPLISSMEFLKLFTDNKEVIAICGTHGKSTTTALVTWLFEVSGQQPSYLIGGQPLNFNHSARYVKGSQYFIIEADEYDISFFDKRSKMHTLWPQYLLINTIEFDHADIFDSIEKIYQSFSYCMRRVHPKGKIFATEKLPEALRDFKNLELVDSHHSYLKFNKADHSIQLQKKTIKADVFGPVIDNLLLALALVNQLDLDDSHIARGLLSFKGVVRRAQFMTFKGQNFCIDFAHHPTSISLLIDSLSTRYDHRFSVLIEKASNSMSQGVFDVQLEKLIKRHANIKFFWMNKAEKSDQSLKSFINYCVCENLSGIILTNNPFRWSQIKCVFSMHSQVE